MEKTTYQHPVIELCRDCKGEGIKHVFPPWDKLNQTEPEVIPCPLCEGNGRVIVSKKTVITIKPFK